MLGRLISTAANYGRGNNTLESATEESHTRNLLYGQSQHTYSLAQSPPNSPYGATNFRPGSFDDRGGLELEEKDIRILIAQDAGAEERPTLLFDSRSVPTVSHVRHASATAPRAGLPNDWKYEAQAAPNLSLESPFRNRSNTMTGGTAPWKRPTRDAGTREEMFLDCMFGVTSSTKSASTTKMHILPGKAKAAPRFESHNSPGETYDQHQRRILLQRARTSNTIVRSYHHGNSSSTNPDSQTQDSILITRLFNVGLSESVAPTTRSDEPLSPSVNDNGDDPVDWPTSVSQTLSSKKPKLVERKVPAFAIGLVISLPRHVEHHGLSAQGRPISRSTHGYSMSSAPSSYSSDMQNSWSFRNAIPESLAAVANSAEEPDKRIDTIVGNEDVILRAISSLEAECARHIYQQLQLALKRVAGPGPKAPKEKSMQRTNQRIISISDTTQISQNRALQTATRQVVRRILYALRIPRVVVGSGFWGGHWSEEARAAYRVCGRRQQNFFLFTLLTAFLGHNTEWLERLAPDWYRRQHRTVAKQQGKSHALSQRTIIISDQRAVARRLIFLLASFMPGVQGLDGLQRPGDDLPASNFSMSSPSSHVVRNESLRRAANRRVREHRLHPGSNDKGVLSTSADSGDSIIAADRPLRFLARKDSDALSIRGSSLLSAIEPEHTRKSSIATASAITTNPTAPIAVFSTQQGSASDSYFPPFVDSNDSIATAGLTNILRRSSSSLGNSSNVSSRWGSLVSGLSEMWSSKQPFAMDSGSVTTHPSTTGSVGRNSGEMRSKRTKSSALQDMVDQLETSQGAFLKSPKTRFVDRDNLSPDEFASPTKQVAAPPRLRVDDKDGVVDVDLDLPGFMRFEPDELFRSPSKSTSRSVATSARDAAESIRSMRSIPASSNLVSSGDSNVAGYLKRCHEDFSLYSIRPYPEFEDDIKRTMTAERSPVGVQGSFPAKLEDEWTSVCTTIIADMRTFSVRKVTLKRKLDTNEHWSTPNSPNLSSTGIIQNIQGPEDVQHTFVDEEIKDFDTALADAVERVLDLGDAIQTPPVLSPRIGHTRNPSSSTIRSTPPSTTAHYSSSYPSVARDYVRQDCRQVVLGVLEDIAKDICNDLGKLERGRDIHGSRSFDASAVKEEMKHENVLREGVKCWLLNLEQARVY